MWNIVRELYVDMIKETVVAGELPYIAWRAIITLIFKKDDRELLTKCRPISLTNYDYKILAFVLSKR